MDDRFNIHGLPTRGWLPAPSPLQAMEGLAASLGLRGLYVKREDALVGPERAAQAPHPAFFGGTKVRKLDAIFAQPPWADADAFVSLGAIGSGHLVACASAAALLGKRLVAHIFDEPLTEGVADNLLWTLRGADEVHWHRGRVAMGLRAPGVLFGGRWRGHALIPPGASNAPATLGTLRGGLELGAQLLALRASGAEPVRRVYVCLGSGGTVAGVALGLALAYARRADPAEPMPEIHAVTAVERVFSPRAALDRLMHETASAASERGLALPPPTRWPTITLRREQLGRGYGHPTAAALGAVQRARAESLTLEPVYTGKTLAALIADARDGFSGHAALWSSVRGPLPPMSWTDADLAQLPRWLASRIAASETATTTAATTTATGRATDPGRRKLLATAALAGVGASGLVGWRVLGGRRLPAEALFVGPRGALSARPATVLAAVAEAVLPPGLSAAQRLEVSWRIDRWLAAVSERTRAEVALLGWALAQTPLLVGVSAARFDELPVAERLEVLRRLHARGGVSADMARGARDLAMVGWYTQPVSWSAIGYDGPLVPAEPRPLPEVWRGRVADAADAADAVSAPGRRSPAAAR